MRLAAALFIASAGVAGAQTRDIPFRLDPPVTVAPPSNRSPYVGFETREVKTLPTERLEGLRRGAGLSYALAAEINNYPGPQHVLDLADQLGLDAEQRERTKKVFERMRREAIAAGEALIAAEAHLDRMFALNQATPDRIDAQTAVAAGQEARLRAIHLKAHLEMMEILAPEQIESYSRLRGYRPEGGGTGQHRHQH
jgi:Spy/CpxP family protein refolding chaperone